jgi:hypothetical protein
METFYAILFPRNISRHILNFPPHLQKRFKLPRGTMRSHSGHAHHNAPHHNNTSTTTTHRVSSLLLQQGVRFDPDLPQTIRLEFAKSNTKVSKPKQVLAPQAVTQPPLVHPLTGRK